MCWDIRSQMAFEMKLNLLDYYLISRENFKSAYLMTLLNFAHFGTNYGVYNPHPLSMCEVSSKTKIAKTFYIAQLKILLEGKQVRISPS